MIEWMTQAHYLGSIRDDGEIDPLFKSLMRHHWMEEAQHAKLDTLIVEALAEGRTEQQIDRAIDEFFEIGAFLDNGLQMQAGFNLDALEKAIGRKVANEDHLWRSSIRPRAGPTSARAWSMSASRPRF